MDHYRLAEYTVFLTVGNYDNFIVMDVKNLGELKFLSSFEIISF